MPGVLTSWKEISCFLGKGVRTVQRWEVELGLPVRRSGSGSHRAIFADPKELNAWARSHPLAPPSAAGESLRKELAVLSAEVGELRERLNRIERPGPAPGISATPEGACLEMALLVQNMKLSGAILRATILQCQAVRLQCQTVRAMTQTLRGQCRTLRITPCASCGEKTGLTLRSDEAAALCSASEDCPLRHMLRIC